MYFKITVIIVLFEVFLLQFYENFANKINENDIVFNATYSYTPGHYLNDSAYRRYFVNTSFHCGLKCTLSSPCAAFNFNMKEKICFLLCNNNGELTINEEWMFYSAIKTKSRRCTGLSRCSLRDENCSEVKDSGGLAKNTNQCYNDSECVNHGPRVDGSFTEWSSWTVCTQTCGVGFQRRRRTCTNPSSFNGGNDCSGDTAQSRNCNEDPCPVVGGFTQWSTWTACSKTCGDGSQSRSRDCTNPTPQNGGKECEGIASDTKACKLENCKHPNPLMVGKFESKLYNPPNNWHFVTITYDASTNSYTWTNRAGRSWKLHPDNSLTDPNTLRLDNDAPYYAENRQTVRFDSEGVYNEHNELYTKVNEFSQ